MEFIKFDENNFANENFQMKVLLNIADVYVTGMFTKFKDEELQVSILDYFDDRYYEFENDKKHIKFYMILD